MRFKAIEIAMERKTVPANVPTESVPEYFASYVFDDRSMQVYLSKEAYNAVRNAIKHGKQIDREVASHVASGMKRWAIDNGAAHYTHWFQPLTGLTAEKHDSLYEAENGVAMEKFSGTTLVQQEPDASSFPNGGLRNTFEARGYTAWDPSSPAFIYENTSGKTLCIPTIFVSYNGEALDFKAPLLKSLHLLDKVATSVCKLFDENINKVTASLGIEQEYFLVDRALYYARPDLLQCGRSLYGYAPAKGQQLDDHYFGSIPDRVINYMYDMEIEALKLGIPLKTRHNEVAPGQYECAPMYEEASLAIDHNQLLMDLMDEVARRHGFKVLFHEKPFAGINGSGKHNNWSLITDTGVNLLSPGSNPNTDLLFLTFFITTIKAVHDHADLIRASIASASNDHRLGANEAPPAIISIFIGSTLTKVLEDFENDVKNVKTKKNKVINFAKIPEIQADNTDRNRTSPFAFTGNKFELRAVGSSQNSSSPITVLCAAVANQLIAFEKEVTDAISKGANKEDTILKLLKTYLNDSKKILFEGNGYSEQWVKEAEKRGLSNIKDTPSALDAFLSKSTIKLMTTNGIFTKEELHARHEINLEAYTKQIQIEGRLMGDIAFTRILPAVIKYQNEVANAIVSLKEAGLKTNATKTHLELLEEINDNFTGLKNAVDAMTNERRKANEIEDAKQKALAYCNKVKKHFDDIRYHADKLERLVADQLWELPKYREILFIK
jgi:glutamine synthetase